MIDPNRQKLCDLLVKEIEESTLTSDEKMSLSTGLNSALEATNGMSQEEKICSLATNNFWQSTTIARIFLTLNKGGKEVQSWKTVIVNCRTQLLIAIITLAALLAYQPQLSSLVQALIGKL